MEELTRALGQFNISETDLDWLWSLNELDGVRAHAPGAHPVLQSLDLFKATEPFIGFAGFLLSEVILGFVGFYLAGAVSNSDWYFDNWIYDRGDGGEVTAVTTAAGGVDGAFVPFAMYYSTITLGFEPTVLLTIGGAYLGAAAENRKWDILQWDLLSPNTYSGAFGGIQQTLWLIDALAYIPEFTKKIGLEGPGETAFVSLSYATGAIISYNNIAQDYQGEYNFKEWDLAGPVVYYGIVRGFQTGTRWPVGFSEIGLDMLQAWDLSKNQKDPVEAFMKNYVIKNRWQIAGALWLAWLTASVENDSFNPKNWDFATFGTVEALINGIVIGKDIYGALIDVRRHFLGARKVDMSLTMMMKPGTKNKVMFRP